LTVKYGDEYESVNY